MGAIFVVSGKGEYYYAAEVHQKRTRTKGSRNMPQNGKITPFYIHTTPLNEQQTVRGEAVVLGNSHGCVHLTPQVRDQMIADGYLKRGTIFEVRKYSDVAPKY